MHHPNYLAALRQRNALSEQELADLVGYASRSAVYRFERGERRPTLRFALACEVVFGEDPRKVFPGLYAKIEDAVLAHAARLDEAVRNQKGAAAARKRKLLLEMVERAAKSGAV